MEVKSFEARNFMSLESVKVDISGTGLTLIRGVNGAGKSSIWDALSWCIFGSTVRGLTNNDIINRAAGENCGVITELNVNGHDFVISRYRKDEEFGDRLIFTKDGKTVELGTRDMTQQRLLEELGIDFELFRCTILFAQEESFNFVSETDKRQKEILSKVKRVNFDDYLINSRRRLKDIDAGVAEYKTKIAVLQSHVIEDPAAEFKEDSEAWETERSATIKERKTRIAELKIQIKELEPKLNDDSKLRELAQKIEKKIGTLRESRSKIREKRDISQRKIGFLSGRLLEISKVDKESDCPVCLQAISREHLKKHVDEVNASLKECNAKMSEIDSEADKLTADIDELSTKQESLRVRLADQMRISSGIAVLKVEIEKAEKTVADQMAMSNPFDSKVAEAIEKQKKIKSKLKELTASIAEAEELAPYVQFWERGFSDKGMKSFIFDSLCATLTAKSNAYLGIMSENFLTITFDTQTQLKTGEIREKFECAVLADGDKVPFKSYSGGEKTRISLAVDMALADIMSDSYGSRFNFIVFDEQDQFLDASGRDHYFNLLKQRAKTQRVFVVSHDSELSSRFPETWTVKKNERGSSIHS